MEDYFIKVKMGDLSFSNKIFGRRVTEEFNEMMAAKRVHKNNTTRSFI